MKDDICDIFLAIQKGKWQLTTFWFNFCSHQNHHCPQWNTEGNYSSISMKHDKKCMVQFLHWWNFLQKIVQILHNTGNIPCVIYAWNKCFINIISRLWFNESHNNLVCKAYKDFLKKHYILWPILGYILDIFRHFTWFVAHNLHGCGKFLAGLFIVSFLVQQTSQINLSVWVIGCLLLHKALT